MNSATVLLRQVHPSFAPAGELTSQAFVPFPKDEGKLSVYDGDLIDAAASFRHYTIRLGLASVGVWGVTIAEVASLGLHATPDPLENSPAHALIQFDRKDDRACRKLAKKLKAAALSRGCLFAP